MRNKDDLRSENALGNSAPGPFIPHVEGTKAGWLAGWLGGNQNKGGAAEPVFRT